MNMRASTKLSQQLTKWPFLNENRPEKTAREAISPAVPAGSMAPSPPSAESQIRPLLQYACALNYNARALGKYRCWIGISMLLEIA
jgi:hypothetical protein